MTKVFAPKTVSVFGEDMSISVLAAAAGKKPEQIWAAMKAGKSAEVAAFGAMAVAVDPLPPTAASLMNGRHLDFVEVYEWAESC